MQLFSEPYVAVAEASPVCILLGILIDWMHEEVYRDSKYVYVFIVSVCWCMSVCAGLVQPWSRPSCDGLHFLSLLSLSSCGQKPCLYVLPQHHVKKPSALSGEVELVEGEGSPPKPASKLSAIMDSLARDMELAKTPSSVSAGC